MRELPFAKVVLAGKLRAELVASLGDADIAGKIIGVNTVNGSCLVLATDSITSGDETTIGNIVTAHVATPTPTPLQVYANAFLTNKTTIFNAFVTYDTAVRNLSASPSVADKQGVLTSTLTILNTLPQSFRDGVNRRAAIFGLPIAPGVPINTWTGPQCNGWCQLIEMWFGQALSGIGCAWVGNLDNVS